MAAGIISSARHCGKGCQTQTMSLVSAGLVRAMVNGASGTLWRWALEDAGRGAFQNGTDRVHPRLFSQERGSGCKLRGYGGRVLKSGEVVEREGDAGKSYSKWGPYTYRSVPSNNVAVNGNLRLGVYSRLCSQERPRPTRAPTPTVPRMKRRAPGIPTQARMTRPPETIAPAFVPGTGMKPRPNS